MTSIPSFQAVVWVDHQNAQIMRFDADHVDVTKVSAHSHHTRQHASKVRTEHEFFGEICNEIAEVKAVLITGSTTGLSDFRHYVNKHYPQMISGIVGWEKVDGPTEGQLVAFARKYFTQHNL